MINKIRKYFYRRKVRRLARRILASQLVMQRKTTASEMVENAIMTAELFYLRWSSEKSK